MRFFGTVVSFAALGNLISQPSTPATAIFAGSVLLKLLPELRLLLQGTNRNANWSPDVHSARLQIGPLRLILRLRVGLALIAILLAAFQPWVALPFLLAAEMFERQLFFQSVQAPKMPGNFGPSGHH